MDMDALMQQYDDMQRAKSQQKKGPQKSHKKANAPTPEEKEAARQGYKLYDYQMEEDRKKRANPMDVWLNRYGTIDKDKIQDEADENEKLHSVSYLNSLHPEARIDLHNMTRDEAWGALELFVEDCIRRGLRKILIVHGKGQHSHGSDPVLGPMVKLFIEQDKRLGRSGHPDRNMGGNGATWVIIK